VCQAVLCRLAGVKAWFEEEWAGIAQPGHGEPSTRLDNCADAGKEAHPVTTRPLGNRQIWLRFFDLAPESGAAVVVDPDAVVVN
jgi:hypothetical protein